MAQCNRQGTIYKRHRFKNRKCEGCGQPQINVYPKKKKDA